MTFKHIFFDLDNTLWDHRRNAEATVKEIFDRAKIESKYSIPFSEFHQVYDQVNDQLWVQIRKDQIDKKYLREHRFYDTFLHFGVDDRKLSRFFDFKFYDSLPEHNDLVPDTLEVLDYLKGKDYTLHIITNGFLEMANQKIYGSGIGSYFTTITTADDAGCRKPDVKMFNYALEQAKAEKNESMLVGDDWDADIEGAKEYGIQPVFFDSLDEGKTENGVLTIDGLKDLETIL